MQIYVKISLRSENICSKIWLYILSEGKVSSDICFTFLLSICVFVLILFFFSGKYVAVFTFSRDFISHLFHFCVHILIFRFFEVFVSLLILFISSFLQFVFLWRLTSALIDSCHLLGSDPSQRIQGRIEILIATI